jgi:hypothetical protein
MAHDERPPIEIDTDLCAQLESHLELVARGAVPNPEFAAGLLRRLRDAVRASATARQGFAPAGRDASGREEPIPYPPAPRD